MSKHINVECLILDNFSGIKSKKRGAESWASDRFCDIIKSRENKHRPTVITSERSIKELYKESLLPREVVDKLLNKMVAFQLVDNQRRVVQGTIDF